MNLNKRIRAFLSLLFISMVISSQAQQSNNTLQILPTISKPIHFFNKDIYSGKSLNFSQQFGLGLQKNISNKIFIGLEAQYGKYNLKDNVLQTYQRFVTSSSAQNFSSSILINGMVNIGYASSKRKGGTKDGPKGQVAIGIGMQRLSANGNNLQIPDPGNGNRLTTVYQESKGTYNNPLLQLSLSETFYVKPYLGITAGVKIQYVRNLQSTVYKTVPTDTSAQGALKNLFASPYIIGKASWQFTVIPSIGIRYVFGGSKGPQVTKNPPDKDPQQQSHGCFGLQWKNNVPKDSCFRGDTLQFGLSRNNLVPGATVYEIYMAPVNNLNNQQLLYSLPYPANSFTIKPVLMDANTEYSIIVKLKNAKKENECLQYMMPVKRCADCCKDVKMPK